MSETYSGCVQKQNTFPFLALVAIATLITIGCSSNATTAPATVTAVPVALASLAVSPSSVVGGSFVTGTATLTAVAPAGGATVLLTGSDPLSVPVSVLVPAGALTGAFAVGTRAVGVTTVRTIGGSYGGKTASVDLSVTLTVLATARFGVTGPTQSESCEMTGGGNTLDCTFTGTTSTAPGTIVFWDWTYGLAKTFSQTTTGPVLKLPAVDCSLMPAPPLPASGVQWFTMTVSLRVRDDLGNVSDVLTDDGVRLIPQGVCGF